MDLASRMSERTPSPRRSTVLRLLPLTLLLLGLILFFALGLQRYLGCDSLRDNWTWLLNWVDGHRLTAIAVFMALYATVVALSVPSAAALTGSRANRPACRLASVTLVP